MVVRPLAPLGQQQAVLEVRLGERLAARLATRLVARLATRLVARLATQLVARLAADWPTGGQALLHAAPLRDSE